MFHLSDRPTCLSKQLPSDMQLDVAFRCCLHCGCFFSFRVLYLAIQHSSPSLTWNCPYCLLPKPTSLPSIACCWCFFHITLHTLNLASNGKYLCPVINCKARHCVVVQPIGLFSSYFSHYCVTAVPSVWIEEVERIQMCACVLVF